MRGVNTSYVAIDALFVLKINLVWDFHCERYCSGRNLRLLLSLGQLGSAR